VGSVTDIVLEFDAATGVSRIPVYVELEPDAIVVVGGERRDNEREMIGFIERGLKAQLATQSLLTGKMFILLDMHPDVPIVRRGEGTKYLEIPTIPSMMEEVSGIFEKLQQLPLEDIVENLNSAIEGANELVRSPALKNAIESLDDTVQSFNKLAQDVDAEVKPLSTRLQDTVETAQATISNLNEKLNSVEEALNGALKDFQKLAQDVNAQVEPLASRVKEVSVAATGALEQAESTLKSVQAELSPDSALYHRLTSTLGQFATMARSLRILADYLEQYPEALLQGKPAAGGS